MLIYFSIWVFPKIEFLPQIIHLFIGFSIIFTIHFGGKIPLFLGWHPYQFTMTIRMPICSKLRRPFAPFSQPLGIINLPHQKKKNDCSTNLFTPWKINMEHNHGGLEDDFPF